jgi:TatA/E family protein of Tat protein translocase
MLNFIKNIGPVEWLVIALVILILFGKKFLIGIGKASGETVRELKHVKKSFTDAVEGKDESGKGKGEV